ncbi:nuclear protein [Mortierella sp. GBA43]|nr:nuclear protein [Mortierella sp. GBA43]
MKQHQDLNGMEQESGMDQHETPNYQDEERGIREQYRKLISTTEDQRKELIDSANNGLLENVDQANKLYKNVSGTHEASLDAKFLSVSADVGMQKAKHLRMGQGGFDETEYIAKLIRPISVRHKSRTITRRKKIVRDPKAMRRPQELREEDIARQENETTKNVMQIAGILQGCANKVNFFELVVNPESFGQTVENIFYLSFLVRDGKVSIVEEDVDDPDRERDDDTEKRSREGANVQPMVELSEVPTAEDYHDGLAKSQLVMDIDMTTWRHLIAVYDIRSSMIPTRHSKNNVEGGKWYG